jgi:hypothetical protein
MKLKRGKRLGIFSEKEHATELNTYDLVMHLQEHFLQKIKGEIC